MAEAGRGQDSQSLEALFCGQTQGKPHVPSLSLLQGATLRGSLKVKRAMTQPGLILHSGSYLADVFKKDSAKSSDTELMVLMSRGGLPCWLRW